MKLSLYWTTRNRVGYLAYVISSWLQNANNPENIEILVAIDEDDSQTEEVLEQINHCTHMISGNDISSFVSFQQNAEIGSLSYKAPDSYKYVSKYNARP